MQPTKAAQGERRRSRATTQRGAHAARAGVRAAGRADLQQGGRAGRHVAGSAGAVHGAPVRRQLSQRSRQAQGLVAGLGPHVAQQVGAPAADHAQEIQSLLRE